MSELTKRLEGSVCYASTNKEWQNVLLQEAADRIDKLEECVREFRKAAKVIATGDLSTALIVSEIVARADALLEE